VPADPDGSGRSERNAVSDLTLAHVVYGLQAASFLVGVSSIVGVILNYVRRKSVSGTWLESHFTWQIRTFWYSLLFGLLGLATLFVVVGYLVLLSVSVLAIYRIAKGWLNLAEGTPMYLKEPRSDTER
jgi:uncharacterized membrane protein